MRNPQPSDQDFCLSSIEVSNGAGVSLSRNTSAHPGNVVRLGLDPRGLDGLLADFLARYTDPKIRDQQERRIAALFRHAGSTDPSRLTVATIVRYVTAPVEGHQRTSNSQPANNTVRQRMSTVRTFLELCRRRGYPICDYDDTFASLRKSFPRTYGKVQDKNPARFLSKDEAFGPLLAACQDRTWKGSRDQLAIRMGLMGIRVTEVLNMTVGNIDGEWLRWTGKGNRPRKVRMGPSFRKMLTKWLAVYEHQMGRTLRKSDPIICRTETSNASSRRANDPAWIVWGQPWKGQNSYREMLMHRADLAGMGHVSPHDLRRSAAAIMHSERSTDGGHRFDLGDIQHVLGHAQPSTTEASYLNHLDNDAQERAGDLLD